jgi:hypothetical protein
MNSRKARRKRQLRDLRKLWEINMILIMPTTTSEPIPKYVNNTC